MTNVHVPQAPAIVSRTIFDLTHNGRVSAKKRGACVAMNP
jgi:hypothetical protein